MPPAQGAQRSLLTLQIAGFVRPKEHQNADKVDLAGLGERLLSDIRRLVRSDPTFGGRTTTRIAESRLMSGASNDGSFDDVGAYVVQPVQLVIFWTDPDDLNTAIEAVVKACKGIKQSAGYKNTVRYVSRRITDADDMESSLLPALWVVRDLGASEELTFIDD